MRIRTRTRAVARQASAVVLLVFVGLTAGDAHAQQPGDAGGQEALSEEEAEYRRVIRGRAEKIVDQLELDADAQRERVVGLIADQYRGLSDIHDARDEKLAQVQRGDGAAAAFTKAVTDRADRQVVELHRAFIAKLTAELPAEKVNGVKDGMTYNVAPITYDAYVRLLPDLTDEQKRFIRANLYEAREYAMDAGSSEKKHAWFGEYKGRINNYLSDAGYDLKQAERERARRQRERE